MVTQQSISLISSSSASSSGFGTGTTSPELAALTSGNDQLSNELLDRMRRRKCLADKELERTACPLATSLVYDRSNSASTVSQSSLFLDQKQKSRLLLLPSFSNNTKAIESNKKSKNEENDEKASESDQNQHMQLDTHIQPTRNLIDIYSSLLSIPPAHQSDQNPTALAALTLFEKLSMFKSFYNQIAVNLQEAYTQAWTNNLINLSQMRQNNGFHSNESSSDVSPGSTKVTKSNSQANQEESASDDGESFDDECAEPTDINLKQPMSQENAQVASSSNGNSTKTKSKTNFSVEALLSVVK